MESNIKEDCTCCDDGVMSVFDPHCPQHSSNVKQGSNTKRTEVTFVFNSQEEREHFMGGLSDGWGENYVDLEWDGDFDQATHFNVSLGQDELDEMDRRKLLRKLRFLGTLSPEELERLKELQNI